MEFPPQSLSKTATKLAIIRINQQKSLSSETDKCFYVEKNERKAKPHLLLT